MVIFIGLEKKTISAILSTMKKPAQTIGTYRAKEGSGRYIVEVALRVMQDSISMEITGGEKPHVGCVILATPTESEAAGCNLQMLTLPEHKDHVLAAPLAEELCLRTGYTISVSAGIHIDNAEKHEIIMLTENARKALDNVLAKMKIEQK